MSQIFESRNKITMADFLASFIFEIDARFVEPFVV